MLYTKHMQNVWTAGKTALLALSFLPAVIFGSPAHASGQIIISNTQVKKITENSVTISWTTSVATASEIDFGPSTQYGSSVGNPQLVGHHSLTIHSSLLMPGTTYHFITKNDDHNGTVAISNDGYFTTRGTQLNVQVIDSGTHKPIEGALVSWNDREDTTDASGWAILSDLPPGDTILAIQYQGVNTAQFVQVIPNAKHSQSIQLGVSTAEAGSNLLVTGVEVIAAFGLGLLVARRAVFIRLTRGLKAAPRRRSQTHHAGTDQALHPDMEPRADTPVSDKPKLSMSVSELHDRFFNRD